MTGQCGSPCDHCCCWCMCRTRFSTRPPCQLRDKRLAEELEQVKEEQALKDAVLALEQERRRGRCDQQLPFHL